MFFGRWNFDGETPEQDQLEKASSLLSSHAPDGARSFRSAGLAIVHHAFHTTKESRRESQPISSASGAVIIFDGRLDNREDIAARVQEPLASGSGDVSIVAKAYDRWGIGCLKNLIGDWALAVWNPTERSIILAKDPVGLRHLYYAVDHGHVSWSTLLDPLVLLASHTFELDLEYIAGWYSLFPAAHVTPYIGIHSVPSASLVCITAKACRTQKYWHFDPSKKIRYRNDHEYEEHFRAVFAQSIDRRIRSGTPVVAELSGGMDSSSIVCMADFLAARSSAPSSRIETLSYYDDSEPNWNERPYFEKVEENRGRTGWHINARGQTSLTLEYDDETFAVTPWSGLKPSEMHLQFADCLRSTGARVLLSGLGGDEVLGGVPTPTPELADLLAGGHLCDFGYQIVRWALAKRQPVWRLCTETLGAFLPSSLARVPKHKGPPAWLTTGFAKKYRDALTGYEKRLKLFGSLPTLQENLAALEAVRRQLACLAQPSGPAYETRYPYLDRDLLEFLYAIPREQLVRPNQRRSLMRRALAGIVPEEILNRKRKALVSRGPRIAISSQWASLVQITRQMVSGSLQIVDPELFRAALENASHDPEARIVLLMRTVEIEMWLRHLARSKFRFVVWPSRADQQTTHYSSAPPLPLNEKFLSAENNARSERR